MTITTTELNTLQVPHVLSPNRDNIEGNRAREFVVVEIWEIERNRLSEQIQQNQMQHEKYFEELNNRNKEKDDNKAWEVSRPRKSIIAAITYGVAFGLISLIENIDNVWLKAGVGALVPTCGYLLSTPALSKCRARWIHDHNTELSE